MAVGELVEPRLVSQSNHKPFQRVVQDLRFDKLNERLASLQSHTIKRAAARLRLGNPIRLV